MPKTLSFIFRLALFAALLGVLPQAIFAATISEYRENINHLRDDLVQMIYPDEDSTEAENDKYTRTVIKEFPELLPAKDKIEWGKTTVEINNQWVYDALERFEKETKPDTRRLILTELYERLGALENELNRFEKATATDRTKDENKQKLSEILRRAEYQKPEEKPKSLFERIYDKVMDWLGKETPKEAEKPQPAPDLSGFSSFAFVLQMLLYALILGIIGFLIYRFAPFFMKKYRRREKSEKEDRVILGERLSADETAQNLFAEAEKMAMAGNLRGAIRKGYIAFLCELSDKKIIGLSQHKTNRDYLRDVRKRADLHNDLLGLTNNYERHWYGFEAARETDWEEFRNAYRKANGTLMN